ncbi:MAG: DEAD/DEAH box helicase [Planctomycetaceae bacterium]|nr:DEAD/DEAH box helicase [Planctomycetaceae bacterium]
MSGSLSDQSSELTFRQLQLSEPLLQALESSGYVTPTPIQAQTIPPLLEGRDVLGQAQTGTGKTAAFALPMLQRVDLALKQPQVLVLTPTRELAIQVAEAFERYAANLPGLSVAPIYGGQDYLIQLRALKRGMHVIVGTPGRVMDHMRRGALKLDGLRGLVLDEADEMLKMGFAEDVEWILTQLPTERQIALFSATVPEPIRRIAQQYLRNPVEITIKQRTATADTVHQRYVVAAPHQKENALSRILEAESIDGVLVFVKTKIATEPLAEYLTQCGHRAAALSGDTAQKQRERTIENLRGGKLDIIVATDVAARGLDVQRISHVINYDLPFDNEAYVHRIGRTGRAGRSGEAILFVHPRERGKLKRLEQGTRQRIEPMDIPSNRTINKQRVARFHEKITASLAHPELEKLTSVIEQYRAANDIPLEHIAAALALLANGESSLFLTEELKQTAFAETRASAGSARPQRSGRSFSADQRRPAATSRRDEALATFRVEVGHAQQVRPGNLVGAIANETGLESSYIGRIQIFDEFSTIDLPHELPREMLEALKKVRVAGLPLNLSRLEARPVREESRYGKRGRPQPKHKKVGSAS